MKKAIRIILPVLLVLAIIVCTGWYLFIYDREFTRDMLLHSARYFDSLGKRAVSGWFYNLAYMQAEDNDAVAIELAQQHIENGNYTKAEYTLSKAIADGGGVELYIALSKTYVAQDKLMDAVNMLNNVTDPQVREQLAALRPSAPTCLPDPNAMGSYYTQYINIAITADSGTIYVSDDNDFPSVATDAYQGAITLVDGENIFNAVAVAENGLVSPVSVFGFTVGGVIEKVTFADLAVENAVREMLMIPAGKDIFSNDLWNITEFTVPEGATTLEDLSHITFLERLTIRESISGQLNHIASLAGLKELSVTDMTVSAEELSLIGALPGLEKLTLRNCGLSTVSGLENAVGLVYLDMGQNAIRNITPLAKLSELQQLYLGHNALNNLEALSSLSKLTAVDVSFNNLSTLSPLYALEALRWLDADNNALTDLSGIQQLTLLEYLEVAHNGIESVAALSACTELSHLNISNNTVTDISSLAELIKLAEFDFSNNQVAQLPQWNKDSELVNIDGSYNLIESLESLVGLKRLNNVFMDYNPEIEEVNILKDCPVLIQVNVFGTKVTDVSELAAQSVVVNFDPTL